MTPNEKLVAIVQAMALHYALVGNRGSDWVASMVAQACNHTPLPGTERDTAVKWLNRERGAPR